MNKSGAVRSVGQTVSAPYIRVAYKLQRVINDSLSGYRSGYRAVGRTAAVIRRVIRRGSILIASVILRRCIRRRLLLLLLSGLLSGGFLCGRLLSCRFFRGCLLSRCLLRSGPLLLLYQFLDLCVVFFNQILIFCRFFVGYGDLRVIIGRSSFLFLQLLLQVSFLLLLLIL